VDNTRGYARVSHSRQWSNYNLYTRDIPLGYERDRRVFIRYTSYDFYTSAF